MRWYERDDIDEFGHYYFNMCVDSDFHNSKKQEELESKLVISNDEQTLLNEAHESESLETVTEAEDESGL